MKYFKYTFKINPVSPAREVLMSELCLLEFDSFEDTEDGMLAYTQLDIDTTKFNSLMAFNLPETVISYESEEAEDKNWNEEWEKNFEAIEIDDLCYIRAPFHSAKSNFKQEVIIHPQMSFGTGHHETTFLICQYLFELDLNEKAVLDMGCGTGVLAILAEKRGARFIEAIDIDDWSYENTIQNIGLNACEKVHAHLGDKSLLTNQSFDIILANINRNILINDMDSYASVLNEGGDIIFSGFYDVDVDLILAKAKELNLKKVALKTKNHWAMLHVRHIS